PAVLARDRPDDRGDIINSNAFPLADVVRELRNLLDEHAEVGAGGRERSCRAGVELEAAMTGAVDQPARHVTARQLREWDRSRLLLQLLVERGLRLFRQSRDEDECETGNRFF